MGAPHLSSLTSSVQLQTMKKMHKTIASQGDGYIASDVNSPESAAELLRLTCADADEVNAENDVDENPLMVQR